MREKVNKVITVIALALVFVFAAVNFKNFKADMSSVDISWSNENLAAQLSDVESQYQTGFIGRKEFIDLYGVVQHGLNKCIFDNFSFMVDKKGIFHSTEYYTYDGEGFAAEMASLKDVLDKRGIPLLYVQAPNKEFYNIDPDMETFSYENEIVSGAMKRMEDRNIPMLDMRDRIASDYTGSLDELFFRTDFHMRTDSELWLANSMEDYLMENYDITFDNQYLLTDMDNYEKKSYPFFGNLSRSVGRLYESPDMFDIYYPKFETDFTVTDWGDASVHEGDFRSVLMNHYEDDDPNLETYWITDYLRYGSPGYKIKNNLDPDGAKVLVITDSMGYRSFAYMSLTVGELTVADPRYFNGNDYMTKTLLNDDYDIVLVYQAKSLLNEKFNISVSQ